MFSKKASRSYLTEGMDLINKGERYKGAKIVLDGSRLYSNQVLDALNPAPVDDIPLLIQTLRHIADEMARAYPDKGEFAKLMETTITLPAIQFSPGKDGKHK